MSDTTPTTEIPAVQQSPTGAPVLPPAVAKWGALIAAVAVAALSSLVIIFPESRGLQAALAIVGSIAGVFGLASPGWRRPAAMLLVVGALGLSGCAALQRVGRATLDCSLPSIQTEALKAVPAVIDHLGGSTSDWSAQLDQLVLLAGDVGVCAIKAAIAELSTRPVPAQNWTAAQISGSRTELQLSRARAWMRANGLEP